MMTRNRAKDYCRDHLQEYVESITRRDAKAGKNMYVCPICHSGENKDGAFSLQGNRFHCFSCDSSGDIYNLIEKTRNLPDFNEQLEFACDFFGISIEKSTQTVKKQAPGRFTGQKHINMPKNPETPSEPQISAENLVFQKEAKAYIENCSRNIGKTDYLAKRGFSEEILEKFSIGYDEARKAVVIPYNSEKNYYISRSVLDKRFYKPSSDKAGLEPIFNLQALYCDDAPCFVCESPLDALSLIQAGGKAIALGGTGSAKLIKQIEREKPACNLVLSFDNDEAGEKAADIVSSELKRLHVLFAKAKYSFDLYDGSKKDPNDLLVSNFSQLQKDIKENVRNAETKIQEEEKRKQEEWRERFVSFRRERFDRQISGKTPMFRTGLAALDEKLCGGLTNELYILGGKTGTGKSAFAMQIAENIAEHGTDVLYFALEMSEKELIARGISKKSKEMEMSGEKSESYSAGQILYFNLNKKTGEFEKIDKSHYQDAENHYFSKTAEHLCVFEGSRNINEIESLVSSYYETFRRIPVVFVDYLQMISPITETDRKTKIDNAVKRLKRLTTEYEIPVFTITSINRASYKEDMTPQSFKESGDLEYTGGILFSLSEPKKEEAETDGEKKRVQLSIMKFRNGQQDTKIDLFYYFKNNLFVEYKKTEPLNAKSFENRKRR